MVAAMPSRPLLLRRLDHLMTVERIYRQEGLTIAMLAAKLDLPEHRLRQAINEGLGYRNFNAFLNRYRIDEAKAALSDPSQRDVPVLTIAMDAGFQSIGPFNRAFKADTGMTPTEFRRDALARSQAIASESDETPESASPAEKSASRILDRARPDWRGPADCKRRSDRLRCSLEGPMTNDRALHRNGCTPSTRSGALPCCSASSCTRRCRSSRHQRGSGSSRTAIPASTLGVLFFAIHVFRMTTFFLIAGFFAHLSFHRRGACGFIKDRLQRIALPLVVGWPILFAAMACGHVLGRQLSQWRPAARPARLAAGAAKISAHPSLVSLCAAGILCRRAGAARRRGLARPRRPHPRASRSSDRPGDAQPARARDPGRADRDRVQPRSDMGRLVRGANAGLTPSSPTCRP